MDRNRIRLDIFPWMAGAYDMSGLKLIVYALVYAELELTCLEIEEILNCTHKEIAPLLNELVDEGLLEKRLATPEEKEVHHWAPKFFKNLYFVNEDMLI